MQSGRRRPSLSSCTSAPQPGTKIAICRKPGRRRPAAAAAAAHGGGFHRLTIRYRDGRPSPVNSRLCTEHIGDKPSRHRLFTRSPNTLPNAWLKYVRKAPAIRVNFGPDPKPTTRASGAGVFVRQMCARDVFGPVVAGQHVRGTAFSRIRRARCVHVGALVHKERCCDVVCGGNPVGRLRLVVELPGPAGRDLAGRDPPVGRPGRATRSGDPVGRRTRPDRRPAASPCRSGRSRVGEGVAGTAPRLGRRQPPPTPAADRASGASTIPGPSRSSRLRATIGSRTGPAHLAG